MSRLRNKNKTLRQNKMKNKHFKKLKKSTNYKISLKNFS